MYNHRKQARGGMRRGRKERQEGVRKSKHKKLKH